MAILAALGGCGGPRAPAAAPAAAPATGNARATTATRPPAAPTPAPAPTSCTARPGSLAYHDLPAASGTIRVVVYQPGCAVSAPGRSFPTLYLLHGSGADETQWPAIGLAATADALIASGVIAPLIVVMPNSGLDPADSSIVDTVLPWADAHLPTATAADRAIGGISAGGAAAIRIVALNPNLFSRLGGHSPVANADPGLLERLAAWRGAIWLDVGQGDGLRPGTEALAASLQTRGLHPELHEWPGQHNRAYWRQHVGDYLRFYSSR